MDVADLLKQADASGPSTLSLALAAGILSVFAAVVWVFG